MKKIIEILTQILNFLHDITNLKRNTFFAVKINEKGNLVGYLRPETGADYCSMSVSHFKSLLSSKEIISFKISEKITLIRIADIDAYIEKMAKVNDDEN